MKHCVQYPDDKFFAVRPCLVGICLGNRAAGKLLGALLYRYNLRVENKDDAENHNAVKVAQGKRPDQDTSYRIFRKQSQLVEDMCGEIDEKTLHNVAVPWLQLLGFLDIEEHIQTNCYIVNVDLVQQALDFYLPGHKKQPAVLHFIKMHGQLEKFLITSDELENSLIDRKTFLLQLEKVLIANRNFSNCKRGRKPRPKADAEAVSKLPQNTKEESKNTREETRVNASALASAAHTPFVSQQEEQAEQIRIATSEQEKAGQNESNAVSSHGSRYPHDNGGSSNPSSAQGTTHSQAATSPAEIIPPDENENYSHSEVTQANSVGVVPSGRAKAVPSDEQKTPPKPQRTPPVHKESVPSSEQIESVFVCLEQTICRLTEQEDFTYSRTKAAKAAVKDWLTGRPEASQKKLSWHVTTLYHKPKDEKSGFYWREHLSVAAILNNYDREIVNYKPDAPGGTPGKPRATALVSEEQAKKNIDKMRQRVAAMQAAAATSAK